jgi:hypothetical protein
MTEDFKETLDELGPEYIQVVDKLKNLGEIEPKNGKFFAKRSVFFKRNGVLLAASLTLVIAMTFYFVKSNWDKKGIAEIDISASKPYFLAFNLTDERSIEEIKRTQKPDGSWNNDLLTRQNATALMKVDKSSLAYRKAMRYLRSKGLSPLSDSEFQSLKELSLLF